MKGKIILFICKGNSGRSQMAEAFFNHLSIKNKAISAGTKPDKKIHPWTIKVMQDVGIDISQQKPKLLTKKILRKADKIVVMDSEILKNIPSQYLTKVEKWQIEKLLGKPIGRIRKIRNQIKKRVKRLIKEIE
jgi:protein-tyrosine-phosphatase